MCSISVISTSDIREESFNLRNFKSLEEGTLEMKKLTSSTSRPIFLRDKSLIYRSDENCEHELSVFVKARICPHGNTDDKNKRSVDIAQFACSSTDSVIVDPSNNLWQFGISEIHDDFTVFARQLLTPHPIKVVNLVAGSSHFIALVKKVEENDDTVVFRDNQSINDVVLTSSCIECRDDDARLSQLMRQADREAIASECILSASELENLKETSDVCQKRRSISTSTEVPSSNKSNPRLRTRARTISATIEETEFPRRPTAITMEEICEQTGSMSLQNPSELSFSFVSMDRVSIREKMEEKGFSHSSSPSNFSRKSFHNSMSAQQGIDLNRECYEVWTWGCNDMGQLGLGDNINRSTPTHVPDLDNLFVVDIVAGRSHSAVLSGGGEVFIWGKSISSEGDFIKKPRLQKLGVNIALSIASDENFLWILVLGQDLSLMLYKCGETHGRPSTMRISLIKDHIPIEIGTATISLILLKTNKTKEMVDILHLYFEAAKYCKLFKGLRDVIQSLKDSSSTEYQEVIKNLYSAVTTLFHVQSSILFAIVSSLVNPSSLSIVKSISLFASTVFLSATNEVIYAYAVCEASGYLHKIEYTKNLENSISLLALEHGTESTNTSTKIAKLFGRITSWLQYLVTSAREYNSLSQNESTRSHLNPYIMEWNSNISLFKRSLEMAKLTRKAWKDKSLASLKTIGRFILTSYEVGSKEDIVKATVVEPKSKSSTRILTVIVFSDILVLDEYRNGFRCFPMHLVWISKEDNLTTIKTPEYEIILELKEGLEDANFHAVCSFWFDPTLQGRRLPSRRSGSHVFSHDCSREFLQGASYEGDWKNGRLHGRGSLTLSNGDVYRGTFFEDKLNGFGEVFSVVHEPSESSGFMSTFYVPSSIPTDKYDIYRGVFENGELNGLAQIRHSDDVSYDGYVKSMQPHGFGVLRGKHLHIGSFRNGEVTGYGVSATNKKKVLGEFVNGELHGRGTVVTIDGTVHEGEWTTGTMTRGIIIAASTDGSFAMEYQGETNGMGQIGKQGVLTVSPSVRLEGSFSGNILNGQIRIHEAVLSTNATAASPVHNMVSSDGPLLSKWAVPAEMRWNSMIAIFVEEELGIKQDTSPDCSSMWSSIVWGMSRGKQLVQGDVRQGFCDALERIPSYDAEWSSGYYAMVTEYWRLSLDNAFHPLRRIFYGVLEVFAVSYGDVGAHKYLHSHAILEAIHLMQEVYRIVRYLFPSLPEDGFSFVPPPTEPPSLLTSPESSPEHGSIASELGQPVRLPLPACNFIYEVFFSNCWQVIFTMYSMHNVEMDQKYWSRAVYLNAHTDVKLLAHLGIRRDLWPIEFDMTKTRDLDKPFIVTTARDRFYRRAVDSIQQMPAMTNPTEKLRILAETFRIMQICVKENTEIGAKHTLSCDDLLPAFIYVVIRSQIRHLGSEIHLIDDFSREFRADGEISMMFTMLQSTYFYICREKSLV